MLFVPNLMLDYAMTYALPTTLLDYVGVVLGVAGLTLCLFGIIHFKSLAKMLCVDAGQLTTSGPYRFGRNPQYVGWILFLLGWALNDWSQWCLAVLLIVGVSLHLLVLIEEQHLQRVFGESYADFCNKTPRYLGWVSEDV
jgi:protein-S-isoprenylcysteine O-methyltransferase Ste14